MIPSKVRLLTADPVKLGNTLDDSTSSIKGMDELRRTLLAGSPTVVGAG